MARKSKKRTQAIAKNGATSNVPVKSSARTPKTMVIRIGAGEVGSSVTQLAKDVRRMMEPETASRLRVCASSMPLYASQTFIPRSQEYWLTCRRNEDRIAYVTM